MDGICALSIAEKARLNRLAFSLWCPINQKQSKAEPAGRVPPDALLLPGSKSKQKCLHAALGMSCARFSGIKNLYCR
jgi:hypothetical protein